MDYLSSNDGLSDHSDFNYFNEPDRRITHSRVYQGWIARSRKTSLEPHRFTSELLIAPGLPGTKTKCSTPATSSPLLNSASSMPILLKNDNENGGARIKNSLTNSNLHASNLDLISDDGTRDTPNFFKMSRRNKAMVVTFCLANFSLGVVYSILAPFFPPEATKKGLSSLMVGIIFGSFELVLLLVSPIYGKFIVQIGAKFMYISGILVCGVCAILFGFLDRAQDGTMYLVLCLVVRCFEALGAAAFSTASFAILACTFPDNVATMFGTLEMFTGLGLMIGAPIGGGLFQIGGFILPFAVLGLFLLIVGFISLFSLPTQRVTTVPKNNSILKLLKIPIVVIASLSLIAGAAIIGFFDVTLSYLLTDEFNLSPALIGLVFLVEPVVYTFMTPVWGWMVDKKPQIGRPIISIGYLITGFSLFFIGPNAYFNYSPGLWVVIVCLIGAGVGISTLAVSFQLITDASMNAGMEDSLATYGLIAGVINGFFSAGSFIGPTAGGLLNDALGFSFSSIIFGGFSILTACLLLVYTYCTFSKCCGIKGSENRSFNRSCVRNCCSCCVISPLISDISFSSSSSIIKTDDYDDNFIKIKFIGGNKRYPLEQLKKSNIGYGTYRNNGTFSVLTDSVERSTSMPTVFFQDPIYDELKTVKHKKKNKKKKIKKVTDDKTDQFSLTCNTRNDELCESNESVNMEHLNKSNNFEKTHFIKFEATGNDSVNKTIFKDNDIKAEIHNNVFVKENCSNINDEAFNSSNLNRKDSFNENNNFIRMQDIFERGSNSFFNKVQDIERVGNISDEICDGELNRYLHLNNSEDIIKQNIIGNSVVNNNFQDTNKISNNFEFSNNVRVAINFKDRTNLNEYEVLLNDNRLIINNNNVNKENVSTNISN